ncbi:MAG: hypothetical protein MUO77_17310, partial [Anaerolineales bacterium]|nr:hypothetical protein [Anaerolineales bacterium]
VAEGIGLSLEANCRYQPPPGNYILLKTKQITGSFGQASRWETVDWNDTPRTSLEPGDTIAVVDRNIACETQYTYSLEVGYSPYHREWLEYRPMSDEMIVILTTAPCSNDSIGQALYLNAEQLQDGIRIEWGFREGGNWADQFQLLPEHEAVEMRLVRFLPERNIQDYIGIGRWTAAPQDLPGANFVVIDEDISLFCEEPIHYTLFVQDLGIMLIPQHVYAQKSVSAPPIPCTGGFRIRDLEINVRPVWHHSNTLRGDRNVLHASVGSSFFGFDWPSEAANLHLVVSNFEDNQPIQLNRVLTLRAASDRLELPHNSSFSETLGPEASIACGGKEYAFFFEFEITEGFFSVLADRGRTFRWTSPPCPPRPPTLENLRAMSDCIESSTGSCIVANWSPPIYQDDWRMPLEQYLVISPNGVNFVPSSQTSFTYELNKLDPRSPGFTAAFLVYGCSAEGICGPPSQMLNIHIPGTPDTWDFWSFDYDSSR